MQAPEFFKRVQDYGQIATQDEALRATSATLTTLGERLGRNETHDLFAQLPSEIVQSLLAVELRGSEDFTVDEFVQRVSTRANVDTATAQRYARAVLSTVQEAVTEGELEDILGQLPREFDSLFTGTRGSSGR